MCSNRLQLNASKTEVLWSVSNRRRDQLPHIPVRVSSDYVTSVNSIRDLRIYLDSDASMKTQVSETVYSCFPVLRQLRSIRRSVCFQIPEIVLSQPRIELSWLSWYANTFGRS